MSISKASITTGWSATSVGAGATVTGTAMDLTASIGASIKVSITTTTAPTTFGVINIQVSSDNTNFYIWSTASIPTTASSVLPYAWELPPQIQYARIDITGGSGTGITATAICMALTGL